MTVGFYSDGKTLCWSPTKYSKEYATFQIPCGKCISCRLEYARQTAIRCVHEASTWPENSFITLTYNDENLGTGKLDYRDIQKFIKVVRNYRFQELLNSTFPKLPQKEQRQLYNSLTKERRLQLYEKIRTSFFVCGEYGEKTKRKHWHILAFNWRPSDCHPKYNTERGDTAYSSDTLTNLWGKGITELGEVTFDSAGYCARYATKKLVHGKDGKHDFHPISRRSSKNAIGKKWIEKNWEDCFRTGFLVFKKRNEYIQCGIPRYYEKWLQKNKPNEWEKYVTEIKPKIMEGAQQKEFKISQEEKKANLLRSSRRGLVQSRNKTRNKIITQKFNQLMKNLKI